MYVRKEANVERGGVGMVKVANKINSKGDRILGFLRRRCNTMIYRVSRITGRVREGKARTFSEVMRRFNRRVIKGGNRLSHVGLKDYMFTSRGGLRVLGSVIRPRILR